MCTARRVEALRRRADQEEEGVRTLSVLTAEGSAVFILTGIVWDNMEGSVEELESRTRAKHVLLVSGEALCCV